MEILHVSKHLPIARMRYSLLPTRWDPTSYNWGEITSLSRVITHSYHTVTQL